MEIGQLEKIKEILTNWNPLGERVSEICDLKDIETESIDILWHLLLLSQYCKL